MTYVDWLVGGLITIVGVLTVVLVRLAFGFGDRKRNRAEQRDRAEPRRQTRGGGA